MSVLGFAQLALDLVFCVLILLLLVARSWRRGSPAEAESYREMTTTLAVLIREMKETAAELDGRLTERRAEVQRALAAADDRLALLRAAASGELPGGPSAAMVSGPRPLPTPAFPPVTRPGPAMEPVPAAAERPGDGRDVAMSEDDRREKYRQALDFARKGWSILEIARFTHLPSGEVELLVKTKGKAVS